MPSGDRFGSRRDGGFAAGQLSPWDAPWDANAGASGPRGDAAASGVLPARIVAWVIDAICIGLIAGVVALVAGALTLASFGLLHGLFGLLALIPFVYSWLFVGSSLAATPGQAICGLGVRDNDTLGRPGLAAAFVWTLGYTVSMLLGAFLLLVALVTRRHRALHDILSGLVVVRVASLAEPAALGARGHGRKFGAA